MIWYGVAVFVGAVIGIWLARTLPPSDRRWWGR